MDGPEVGIKVYEFVSATAVVSVYYTDRATIDFNTKIRADEEKNEGISGRDLWERIK
jgi:hypothetical protein